MFDKSDDAQFQSFRSACERFASRYVMTELSRELGMREQMLRNKLNPTQPHQLTVRDLIALYMVTKDESLIDGALLDCGLTAVRLPSVADEDPQLLRRAIQLNAVVGGIGSQAMEIVERGRVTKTQRNMLVDAATVALGDLVIFINEIDAKFQAVPGLPGVFY